MSSTIQLSIKQLTNLLEVAKEQKSKNSSLSNTIEIKVIKHTDSHNGSDKCQFRLLSVYQDANGEFLGTN